MLSIQDLLDDLPAAENVAVAVETLVTQIVSQLHTSVANGNLAEVQQFADALHDHKASVANAVGTVSSDSPRVTQSPAAAPAPAVNSPAGQPIRQESVLPEPQAEPYPTYTPPPGTPGATPNTSSSTRPGASANYATKVDSGGTTSNTSGGSATSPMTPPLSGGTQSSTDEED